MKTGIFTIGGFKQTERKSVGMDEIQRRLEWRYNDMGRCEVYDLRTWKSDMTGLAALAKRDGVARAIVIGYSHGGGYAAPRLVKQLQKRGIQIRLVLLCDPVYRPLWLPRWTLAQVLSFRALIPGSAVIRFPEPVVALYGVRQEQSIPRAHRVRIGRSEAMEMRLLTGYDHDEIDESEEWFSLVDESVEEVLA